MKTTTLEEIQAQMDSQDAALAELAKLVELLPADVLVPRSALHELEEATEPPHPAPMPTVTLLALRG